MRILLVGNYVPDGSHSMQGYASWLHRVLTARGYDVTLTRPPVWFSRPARGPAMIKYAGYVDKFLLFPLYLRWVAGHYDLVHILDHSNSMYLAPVRSRPNLITCHDLIAIRAAQGEFADMATKWPGRVLQQWILAGLRGASHVLCVSSNTADQLKAIAGPSASRIQVLPLALNWSFAPPAIEDGKLLARFGLRTGDLYLLHVGGNLWYKNRGAVLRIFARLAAMPQYAGLRLVLTGGLTPDLRALAQQQQVGSRIVEACNVSREELRALYGHAHVLLFPSREEGFGWPILEAQACGCPVITTARPPMTEVAGEAAILIEPEDVAGAAEAIVAGLNHRESLRAAGFANLRRFDESRIVDGYCALYEEIAGTHQLSRAVAPAP